jgi:hypothetical protein
MRLYSTAGTSELSLKAEQFPMARSPFLLILGLAGGALLLTGMVNRQSPSSAPPTQPPTPAESAEAARVLDRAVADYSPARVPWLEVKLWQRNQDEGVAYEVHGRFASAPGHRLRLELRTQVGATQGTLKLVSDGKALWQCNQAGSEPPKVILGELAKLEPGVNTEEWVDWARGETLRDLAFGGVGPLVKGLRDKLQGLRAEKVRWNEREVVRVSGTWPEYQGKYAGHPDFARPRHFPRLCALYLDANTFWLHRLEWWATEGTKDGPVLVLETEFREPVLNRALPAERCTQEFDIPK